MPQISLIVAMSQNRIIGENNQLLWHLPNDLQHFKKVTMGKPIIMGRKTFESIGKALPGRKNIVLTHQQDLTLPGAEIAHTVEEALAKAESDEIMIVGGGEIYRLFFPQVTTMYITKVHTVIEGDTAFLDFNEADWIETSCEAFLADEKHKFGYSFITLKRKDSTELLR